MRWSSLAEAQNPHTAKNERSDPGDADRDRGPSLAHSLGDDRDAEKQSAKENKNVIPLEAPGLSCGIVGVVDAVVRKGHVSFQERASR